MQFVLFLKRQVLIPSIFFHDQVISSHSDELILEAFKKMKDNQIGGLPVVEGPIKKIVGNVSIKDIRFLLLKQKLFTNFR